MIRKIKTQEDLDREKRRNQIIIGSVMILLLVVSTAGYSLMSGDSNDKSFAEEEGFDFFRENNLWKVNVNSQIYGFQYLPSEVVNVSINGTYDISTYSGQPLYFVGNSPAIPEILNNLQRYVLRSQEACLNGTNCTGNLPVKGCDSNLIIFESGDETRVYKKENCVFVVGEHVRATDKFLYEALKII